MVVVSTLSRIASKGAKAVSEASTKILASNMATAQGHYTLPDLPYDYNALEPVISSEIMTLHHTKHHAAYVKNLNAAMDKLEASIASKDLLGQLAVHQAIKFNGGGHTNHSIFWKNLTPVSKYTPPSGQLEQDINGRFGSLENLKKEMNAKTGAIQGSGWGWLAYNKASQGLEIVTKANQDPVEGPYVPLFGIDVWEHAFYLQYKNAKPDYLNAIWQVVNWKDVAQRYEEAKKN
eukprot:TRINITY_DN40579_c0_g1_i1.p1 TRINITY_DN40579_c0_g1~~TRINITY_DN40579_c0_g1_i1.p1  ORF type:complete len:234 (+),score=21.72 TRINITY_DN40579_c0_g1_i1:113-814(+)